MSEPVAEDVPAAPKLEPEPEPEPEPSPPAIVEAEPVRVAKPIPIVVHVPGIRGTVLPPLATIDGVPATTPDPSWPGIARDLRTLTGRREMRVVETEPGIHVVGLEPGIGDWLNGRDGAFARLRTLGGQPFGLAVLVIPRRAEPFVATRAPYYVDGESKPILGEMWIAHQGEDGGWEALRFGSAAYDAMRWHEAADRAVRA